MAAGVSVTAAQPPPKGSSVTGGGTFNEGLIITVDANAQPRSSAASGSIYVQTAVGDFYGTVTCLQVLDGLAGISGTVDPETSPGMTSSPNFEFYVADDSSTSGIDLFQLHFENFLPDCTPKFPVSPAGLTTGYIVLIQGKKLK